MIPDALYFARAAAEALMTDVGSIHRPVADTDTRIDPVSLLYLIDTPPTLIYSSGPCFLGEKRIQNPTAQSTAGDFPYVEVASLLLPTSAPAIQVQDIFTLEQAPDHPQHVGLRFRITFVNPGTQLKTLRCQMEVVTG